MRNKIRSLFSNEPKDRDAPVELYSPEEGRSMEAEGDIAREKVPENSSRSMLKNASIESIARSFRLPWGESPDGRAQSAKAPSPTGSGRLNKPQPERQRSVGNLADSQHTSRSLKSMFMFGSRKSSHKSSHDQGPPSSGILSSRSSKGSPFSDMMTSIKSTATVTMPEPLQMAGSPMPFAMPGVAPSAVDLTPGTVPSGGAGVGGVDRTSVLKHQLEQLQVQLQALQTKATERIQTKPAATTANSTISAADATTASDANGSTKALDSPIPAAPVSTPTGPMPNVLSVGPASHVIEWADDDSSRYSDAHTSVASLPQSIAGGITPAKNTSIYSMHPSTNEIQAQDGPNAYQSLGRAQQSHPTVIEASSLFGPPAHNRLDAPAVSPMSASANGAAATSGPSRLSLVTGFSTSKTHLKQTSPGITPTYTGPAPWQISHAATVIGDDDDGSSTQGNAFGLTRTDVDDSEASKARTNRSLADFMKTVMKGVGDVSRSVSFQKESPRTSGAKTKLPSMAGAGDSSHSDTKEGGSRLPSTGGSILLQTTASMRRELDNLVHVAPKRAGQSRRNSIDGLTKAMTKSFTQAITRRGSMDTSRMKDPDEAELDEAGAVLPAPEPDLQSGIVQAPPPPQRYSLEGHQPTLITMPQSPTYTSGVAASPEKRVTSDVAKAAPSPSGGKPLVYGTSQQLITTVSGRLVSSTSVHQVSDDRSPTNTNNNAGDIKSTGMGLGRLLVPFSSSPGAGKGSTVQDPKRKTKGKSNHSTKAILDSQPISDLHESLSDSSETYPTESPTPANHQLPVQGSNMSEVGGIRTLGMDSGHTSRSAATSSVAASQPHVLVTQPPQPTSLPSTQPPPHSLGDSPHNGVQFHDRFNTHQAHLHPPTHDHVTSSSPGAIATPAPATHTPTTTPLHVQHSKPTAKPPALPIRSQVSVSKGPTKSKGSQIATNSTPVTTTPTSNQPTDPNMNSTAIPTQATHSSPRPSTPATTPVRAISYIPVISHSLEGVNDFQLDSGDMLAPIVTRRGNASSATGPSSGMFSPSGPNTPSAGAGAGSVERVQSTVDLLMSKLMSLPSEIRMQIAQDLTRRGVGLSPTHSQGMALAPTSSAGVPVTFTHSSTDTLNVSAPAQPTPASSQPTTFPSTVPLPAMSQPQPNHTSPTSQAVTAPPAHDWNDPHTLQHHPQVPNLLPEPSASPDPLPLPISPLTSPVIVTAVPIAAPAVPFEPPSLPTQPPTSSFSSTATPTAGTNQYYNRTMSRNSRATQQDIRSSPPDPGLSRTNSPHRKVSSAPQAPDTDAEAAMAAAAWNASHAPFMEPPMMVPLPSMMHVPQMSGYVPLETSRGMTMAAVLAAAARLEAEEFDPQPSAANVIPAHVLHAFGSSSAASSDPSTPVASNPYLNSLRQPSIFSSPARSQWCLAPMLPPHPLMFALAPSGLLAPGMPTTDSPRAAQHDTPPHWQPQPSALGPTRFHQSASHGRSPLSGAGIAPGSGSTTAAGTPTATAGPQSRGLSAQQSTPRTLSPMSSYFADSGVWSPAAASMDPRTGYARGVSPLHYVAVQPSSMSTSPAGAMPLLQHPSGMLFQDMHPMMQQSMQSMQSMQWVMSSPMQMSGTWGPESLPSMTAPPRSPLRGERMQLASHPLRRPE